MDAMISVIIPIYNMERYMDRCMDSVLKQSYRNLEIILVDDGSTDSSSRKCDEWAAKDARIRVIHQKNAGLVQARNTGVSNAAADYLVFVDSDDYIKENAIQLLYERLTTDGSDMAIGKRIHVFADGTEREEERCWMQDAVLTPEELFAQDQLKEGQRGAVEIWGKIYRREVFDGVECPDVRCGEDLWVYPELVLRCKRISIVDAPIYYYVCREDSLSHKQSTQSRLDELKANLRYSRFLFDKGFVQGAQKFLLLALDMTRMIEGAEREAREIWAAYYSDREVMKLLKNLGLKARIKWLCVKCRCIDQLVKGLKRILRRK